MGLSNGYGDGLTYAEVGTTGYQSQTNTGFEPDGYGAPSSNALGAGDTPYQTDLYSDGYQENVFAANQFDTPYGETASNPDPELEL
ncbi:hypothetical protein IQ257_06625 [Coleofasciculus sp. LEGE 07092]|nr:hypothetical protein [Coleofasciculus sp. LEGE 07081]MBE9148190.1 hypothetical protein [Coleofasciculus sp. LEGE 07092]